MTQPEPLRRRPLSRERVLTEAVALADLDGIDALTMRSLAQHLSVVPMALYKHVAHKEALLDGMVEHVVGEIDQADGSGDWRADVRALILGARRALVRHPWALEAIRSRPSPTPAMLAHLDALSGAFLRGGLSDALTHHLMHTLGTRMWGYTDDLFPAAPPLDPDAARAQREALADRFPALARMAAAASHEDGSVVGGGCDDQHEFEFALDLILDGADALHRSGWPSQTGSA